jgi:uncharacterized protein (TIGR02246 family)
MPDEQAIRELIGSWMRATAAGDVSQLRALMAEDVVFLLPGQPPMRGRGAFATNFEAAIHRVRIEATSDIQEIQVNGDWAYCWNQLTVTMTPRNGGSAARHAGHVLTVFRKMNDHWVLYRDANMLTAEPSESSRT